MLAGGLGLPLGKGRAEFDEALSSARDVRRKLETAWRGASLFGLRGATGATGWGTRVLRDRRLAELAQLDPRNGFFGGTDGA